ncbi:SelA-like pyridoxal phosphate-dependent enzyme [Kitasatospora viridis]|uniref:L-seryl-tRNA(Ser) seleniumtransferase/D-glucosaminate-6-phosphate ammonia-lyase n=1 Tax=Kitasatospora viridis TaxID=281105 RepID=A0A561SG22_9ACTN|nr:SelA-like pyridoxal phosphate-dependent enzyme [Kitasatospora viridis]TWF73798.1 L-seryl-tRNA(Ser) seleniumtransferase/D-glucosaminate-6-phosphate ammonia-lyase [Kitasatospora viridis]
MDYRDLGVTPVVSAQANSTPLGGCTLSDGVIAAMGSAARSHVDMDELWRAAGEFLAVVTGAADACPVTGAAAGMAIAVAACVAGTDPLRVRQLPDPGDRPNEVVLQKGHSISYGGAPITQMIALGGGRTVEVGAVNETLPSHVAGAITARTAALVYVTSTTHAIHRRGVPLTELVAIGRTHGVPVIVDAAGESDLRAWVAAGADLVIYSGPKMLGAPTSGFICGSAGLVAACRAQYLGIARPMKVGKENLMGLLQAVREYTDVPEAERSAAQHARMAALAARLGELPGLSARVTQDESGRPIHRVTLTVDPAAAGLGAAELAAAMTAGDPAIHLRDFKLHLGVLEVDPRALSTDGEEAVVRRLAELLPERGAARTVAGAAR